MSELDALRFPIGPFVMPTTVTPEMLARHLAEIEQLPARIRRETDGLSDAQLDTRYRDGGWTIRQVVHHCADSHMNALLRFKWALTESTPVIKPYFEDRWGELADNRTMPIAPSLQIIDGVHARWSGLMRAMKPADFQKGFVHPEHRKELKLCEVAAMYAWHGNHHAAHIASLKRRKGW